MQCREAVEGTVNQTLHWGVGVPCVSTISTAWPRGYHCFSQAHDGDTSHALPRCS